MESKMFEDMDITEREVHSMTEAFKSKEFRKLLVEYCEEMADPKNQELYQTEMIQYEKERGVDLTFITPQPGFVIKTSINGGEKGFINICTSEKVAKPTSHYGADSEGKQGLNWSIPLTQAPPRRDVDNKKNNCTVFDVVFHPDVLHLAARNKAFRQLVVDTACDAVEKAFKVVVDRTNLKFPKMAFKGTPKPTVVRKKCYSDNKSEAIVSSDSQNNDNSSEGDDDGSILNLMPPHKSDINNLNGDRSPQQITPSGVVPEYTTPKYKLVHRKEVEMHKMTNDRDAKMNCTIPKELVLTVDLPLLKSAANLTLDVTGKSVELISERPAKYKLSLKLPYSVLDNGQAKFDSGKRQLTVTLPVLKEQVSKPIQIDDSGVDSPLNSHSSSENLTEDGDLSMPVYSSFLDKDTSYSLPSFSCNVLDNLIAFTLNVKNVDPDSLQFEKDDNSVHVKFYSMGSGFVPSHFAFFVRFESGAIQDISVEPWDNNVIVQMEMSAAFAGNYFTGIDPAEAHKVGHLKTNFIQPEKTDDQNDDDSIEQNPQIEVKEISDKEIQIELSKPSEQKQVESCEGEVGEDEDEEVFVKEVPKARNKNKKNRKGRSMSESCCEELSLNEKLKQEKEQLMKSALPPMDNSKNLRKSRSMSESSGEEHLNSPPFRFKSILKKRAFNRSISESSVDDHGMFSASLDYGVACSFDNIPEESDDKLSESCKKSVKFSDVIKKQLFRADASIVGRKLKNLKKRAKKRAQDARRLSESENSEGEAEKEKKSSMKIGNRRDSGVECSSDGGACSSSVEETSSVNKAASKRESKKAAKKGAAKPIDLEFKSGMIFNLEM